MIGYTGQDQGSEIETFRPNYNTNILDLLRGNINTLIDFMKLEQEHNVRQDIRLGTLEDQMEEQERHMDWLVGYLAGKLQKDLRLKRLEEDMEEQERQIDWLVDYLAVKLQPTLCP